MVFASLKVKPKLFNFVVFNPCQSSPSLAHPCSFLVPQFRAYYYLLRVFLSL